MSKSSKHSETPWTESDVGELQSFVEEEMSVEEMAEELGRTPDAIRAKLAKEGISLRAAQQDVDDE